MNPFVLVGFDLLISALLVVLAMYAIWTRIRPYLVDGSGRINDPVRGRTDPESGPEEGPAQDRPRDWESRALTQEVTELTRQGCSVEETARRLQIPTREVETVLAISRMTKTRGEGSYASAVLAGAGQGGAVHSTAR